MGEKLYIQYFFTIFVLGTIGRDVAVRKKEKQELSIVENIFVLDIFDCEIVSIMGDNSAEILDHLEAKWGYEDCDIDFKGYTDILPGVTYTLTVIMLYIKKDISPGIIAHESLHAVNFITSHLRIQDEETQAYLLDYIVNKQHLFYVEELTNWYHLN